MGCWNETCVLSRTPIGYGAPVVALTTVTGPTFRGPSGGGFETSLLFGLPLQGRYDDYGGVEQLVHPLQKEFADKAFLASGMYRSHTTKKSLGSATHRWVASSPDILWGLEHQLKEVFFHKLGITVGEADSYEEAARAKSLQAFKDCQEALNALGTALGTAALPEAEDAFLNALFTEVSKAFGPEQAWGAWSYLRRHGLFAHIGVMMMHQRVYDAVVAEFSKRQVYKHGSKERRSVRDYLKQRLEDWAPAYEAEHKRLVEMFSAGNTATGISPRYIGRMVDDMGPKNSYMKPLTSPWRAPETPLKGHFWGGASVTEVLAAHELDDILDFMVFQWARNYLRIDLTPPSSGSQNEETKLHFKLMQAAYRTLRGTKGLKEDFVGFLHGD